MSSVLIKSRRLVAGGKVGPGGVLIRDGRVEALVPHSLPAPAGVALYDAEGLAVMPGLVDSHVHVNEPGRTAWEGFATATDAAAAGGVTTIVDMPLNCIPVTTSAAALQAKLRALEGQLRVDAAFWGGVVPGNAGELEALAAAGARGFKAFLCDSGVDDFPRATEQDLRLAMPILARLGLPLLLHAELCRAPAEPSDGGPRSYPAYVASRPPAWEVEAVELAARLCGELRCRTHIVHLSAAQALPAIARAKTADSPLTVETCPHYLTFAAEEIEPGRTDLKCAPPIRARANREKLWAAVQSGAIDMIVSDHSPCSPELKKLESGDLTQAWGGIAGLQFTLPAAWTGLSARGGSLPELSRLVSEAPARLAGLARKGRLEPGFDGDVVIWDPDAPMIPTPETTRHRHKLSPYAGRTLRGSTAAVFLRGRTISGGAAAATDRRGRALLSKED